MPRARGACRLLRLPPGPAGRRDFAGPADIRGGRKLYLECRGTGSPMVVSASVLRYFADICVTARPAVSDGADHIFSSTIIPFPFWQIEASNETVIPREASRHGPSHRHDLL